MIFLIDHKAGHSLATFIRENPNSVVSGKIEMPQAPNGNWDSTQPGVEGRDRWVLGNDLDAIFRDMFDPECTSFVLDGMAQTAPMPNAKRSGGFYCGAGDNGGVHINSSVINHAYALLVDGGAFNGQAIDGIGFTKALNFYYRAMLFYQTELTGFAEHATALEQSCQDLVGEVLDPVIDTDLDHANGFGQLQIVPSDCLELAKVIAATQLREPTLCNVEPMFQQDPPLACGSAESIMEDWRQDFSNGLDGGWTQNTVGSSADYNPEDKHWRHLAVGAPEGRTDVMFAPNPGAPSCGPELARNGIASLETPSLTVGPVANGFSVLSFEHYITSYVLAPEHGSTVLDGGNLSYRIQNEDDGGWSDWTLVPPESFLYNGYNQFLFSGFDTGNPLGIAPVFGGTNVNSNKGSWGISQVNLSSLPGVSSGDMIRIRFNFGLNGWGLCRGGGGWYISDVTVSNCIGRCGDGLVLGSEECDDGNDTDDGNGCSETCTRNGVCGDGNVDTYFEECDGHSGCDGLNCTWQDCGNGILNDGEECDYDGFMEGCSQDCRIVSECGNGLVEIGEECDDGNRVDDTNGCSARCEFNSVCGDGVVQDQAEECDDGNDLDDGNGCTETCEVSGRCGDGIVQSLFEECDDGDQFDSGNGCTQNCRFASSTPTMPNGVSTVVGLEDELLVISGDVLFQRQPNVVIHSVEPSENGTLTFEPDVSIKFMPKANWYGEESITYRLRSSLGDQNNTPSTEPIEVKVVILAVNDVPTVTAKTVSTPEDTAVEIELEGDDVENDDLTWIASNPAFGQLSGSGPRYTYTPNADFSGVDSFSVTVNDGELNALPARVQISVSPINDPPVLDNLAAETREGSSISILIRGNDQEGDPLTYTASEPTHGEVNIAGDALIYTPDDNFSGEDRFTIIADDGEAQSMPAQVVITVIGVNNAPTAEPDSLTIDEDTIGSIDAVANDTDDATTVLNITNYTQGLNGAVGIGVDGVLSYTPRANFHGVDRFLYTVSDEMGVTASAEVTVTVNPVNDAPTVENLDIVMARDGVSTQSIVSEDVDGDTLTFTATAPSHGTVEIVQSQLVYTPIAGYEGSDRFTVIANDGTTTSIPAVVSVEVRASNDGPVAVADAAVTDEDTAVRIDTLSNDTDADGDVLSITNYTQGLNGAVGIGVDGVLSYTPRANFHGVDRFLYTVSDEMGVTASAEVTVTVNPVNDAPTVENLDIVMARDGVSTQSIVSEDVDGDTLTFTATAPSHGIVEIVQSQLVYTPIAGYEGSDRFTVIANDGTTTSIPAVVSVEVRASNDGPVAVADAAVTDEDTAVRIDTLSNDTDADGDVLSITNYTQGLNGAVGIGVDGVLSYTPRANFHGVDRFLYTVSDEMGMTASAEVTVTVNPVNDAPILSSLSLETQRDEPVSFRIEARDVDDDTLTYTASEPTHGMVQIEGDQAVYTPSMGFAGVDRFTLRASDGRAISMPVTVSIQINEVNQPPVAIADNVVLDEDTIASIDVLTNDLDEGQIQLFNFTQPMHGTVSDTVDGELVYAPNANFYGTDRFLYTIVDEAGLTAVNEVTAIVNAINDAPSIGEFSATTPKNTPITLTIIGEDVDGDALSYSASEALNGSVEMIDNEVVYIPNHNFFGQDSFSVVANDGTVDSPPADITVEVSNLNQPPVANDDVSETDEDTPVSIHVLENDIDPDGDGLRVISFTQGLNGAVGSSDEGVLIYTPAINFNGTDRFMYTLVDTFGISSVGQVVVTVNPINDAPSMPTPLEPAAGSRIEVGQITFGWTPSTDIDGDNITYQLSIYQDDNEVESGNTDESSLSINFAEPLTGVFTWVVTAVDDNGAESGRSIESEFNVVVPLNVSQDSSGCYMNSNRNQLPFGWHLGFLIALAVRCRRSYS